MSLVKLSDVNKIYKGSDLSFQALRDVKLSISKGEFLAITGPSGSGKSTLMNIIGLLDRPTSGTYELEGKNMAKLDDNYLSEIRNKKIGFIFQNFNLLNRTNAINNVSLPLIYAGVPESERISKAKKSLESVGLLDKLNSTPSQLSGGQQQRVAIARALITSPDIILADEPTGNLDSKTGTEIITIFKKLNKSGHTIILITHDMNIARNADRVIKMRDGEIIK